MEVLDHPDIRRRMRDGEDAPVPVICPVCQEDCEKIYLDIEGDPSGCENCVDSISSFDWVLKVYGEARNVIRCKFCGKNCEDVYLDIEKKMFACDGCVAVKDAYDWADKYYKNSP